MAKRKGKAEFAKWFGPTLDALRALGYSGKPKEVVEKIASDLDLDEDYLNQTLEL